MSQPKRVKDIPVGVLIIVLAQFLFYGVVYLANFPSFWELFGIVLLTLLTSDMVNIGVRLIKGFDLVELDKQ
jgi:hypothetical protein